MRRRIREGRQSSVCANILVPCIFNERATIGPTIPCHIIWLFIWLWLPQYEKVKINWFCGCNWWVWAWDCWVNQELMIRRVGLMESMSYVNEWNQKLSQGEKIEELGEWVESEVESKGWVKRRRLSRWELSQDWVDDTWVDDNWVKESWGKWSQGVESIRGDWVNESWVKELSQGVESRRKIREKDEGEVRVIREYSSENMHPF